MQIKLPNDTEAERWLLACAMIDGPGVINDALAEGIKAELFYRASNGSLFEVLHHLVAQGDSTDPAVVVNELQQKNRLAEFGGVPGITEIASELPTTLQAKTAIRRIKEAAARRALAMAALEMGEKVNDQSATAAEMVETTMKRISDITPAQRPESWADALRAANEYIERHTDPDRANEEDKDVVPFGFAGMDERFGPMRLGQMVVVAARPSVGKSSLARQIAHHTAITRGQQVVFASLEVLGRSLALNLAQTISGVPHKALTPRITPDRKHAFAQALKGTATSTFDIMAGSNISLAALQAKAERLRSRGTPLRLVVLDYLQLMPDCAPDKGETRAGSVGRVSRALKAFALAHNCVVMVLSQLNRDSAKDGREPALYDLRESGDIEQDADKVILLHRPAENPSNGQPQPETAPVKLVPTYYVSAIQAKGRDDGTGSTPLQFLRAITRFEEPPEKTR